MNEAHAFRLFTICVDENNLFGNSFRQDVRQLGVAVCQLIVHAGISSILNNTYTIDAFLLEYQLLDFFNVFFVLVKTSCITETWCVDNREIPMANFEFILYSFVSLGLRLIFIRILSRIFVNCRTILNVLSPTDYFFQIWQEVQQRCFSHSCSAKQQDNKVLFEAFVGCGKDILDDLFCFDTWQPHSNLLKLFKNQSSSLS